jgi:2-desacetyl-2-hydroxyethyl bacteriochlorophyllide A dehydrogenase
LKIANIKLDDWVYQLSRKGEFMKAAVYKKEGTISVEELEVRELLENEILIKVMACGVCQTDRHIASGHEGATKNENDVVLGHELSGVVEKVGANVKQFELGDRVCIDPNMMCGRCFSCKNGEAHMCDNMIATGVNLNGGFAEQCIVLESQAFKINDNVSFEEAAMGEPIACCLHGIDLAEITVGDTVVVVGGGPIGLMMAQLSKLAGAANVIVVEPMKEKHELVVKLGADEVLNPFEQDINEILKKYTNVDIVIECVGKIQTMKNAINYAGKKANVLFFGLCGAEETLEILPFEFFKKELTLKSSFVNPYTLGRAVELLNSKKINVKDLISDVVNIDDINEVFERHDYKGKVIIKP